MSSMKNILAAASLAVLSVAGITAAAAQPWDHHGGRAYERHNASSTAPRSAGCAWRRPCASIVTG